MVNLKQTHVNFFPHAVPFTKSMFAAIVHTKFDYELS